MQAPLDRPFAPESAARPDASRYPESFGYRLKNALLGRPMVSEQLGGEKLSKKLALGVLAPDMISSSAYGTEEMLVIMFPIIGLGAFAMVIPVTLAIIAVLFFVTLSYMQVLGIYTTVGGSYIVSRDNFGPRIAQIAAVALLIDYIVTVAVQTSAGTANLTSLYPVLTQYTVPITVAVTLLMLYGNLRGIREAGKIFAFPSYFFIASLGFVVIVGLIKGVLGLLHPLPIPEQSSLGWGSIGSPNNQSFLMGLGVFYTLKAFAQGGVSLTGLEAVSDGVSSFRKPVTRNSRITLGLMCCILGFLVVGTSLIAHWTHPVPYYAGTPTVVSQEVHAVLGSGAIGSVLFGIVQLATVLILFTGGNTSFNGFPYLASFVAGDSFLPRQLTKRGHRLAYSNGIVILAIVAIILIIIFQARLDALVGLYAIGVFTGFTMAGAGMLKHHLVHKGAHWKLGALVNGFSSVLSFAVVGILLVTKFTEGAWIVAVVGPPMYWGLIRINRQYRVESDQLEVGAADATEAPVLSRHVVVVLIEQLDNASARAIQYARSLRPDELRVVHFNIDVSDTEKLKDEWERLGLARLPLDLIECRDRRIDRAALEYVAGVTEDGQTECTVLLPRRAFRSRLQWILHDRTADKIADAVEIVPHVSATIVPYKVESKIRKRLSRELSVQKTEEQHEVHKPQVTALTDIDRALARRAAGTTPISELQWRNRAEVAGRIKSMRVQTAKGTTNLECTVTDDTGDLLLIFQGRPKIPGIEPGARLVAEGMVGSWDRHLAMLNPDYELVAGHQE